MKEKLHILFLTGWYPSRVTPVAGDFIKRHAEAISSIHNVTVIHVKTDPKAQKRIEILDDSKDNIRTLIAYVKPASTIFTKAFLFIKAYTILLKKAENFDITHVNKLYPAGIIAILLKAFKKKKYIISEHYHIYHKPYNSEIGFIEKTFSKLITKNASFVCPVSDNLGVAMQDFGLKGNYHKVPNVVKTAIFYPKEIKSKGRFTLLHVSSMASMKNVDKILEVVAKLQQHCDDFVFYCIGNYSEQLEAYARTLKIESEKIKFIDLIDQEELSEYYRKSDVFLLFSSIENLPCVILESFSSGTPVISTNVGGISEYFPKDFGYLIEKSNQIQLLERILRIKDKSEIEQPNKMHNYVEKNFSPKSIAHAFDKLYKQIS